ncbi:MAG: hypothetical protein ABN483_04605, partial [Pantoea agglomerans]
LHFNTHAAYSEPVRHPLWQSPQVNPSSRRENSLLPGAATSSHPLPKSEAQHNEVTASDERSIFCNQMSTKTAPCALKLAAVR